MLSLAQVLRPHSVTLQVLYLDLVQDDGCQHLLSLSQALRLHFAEAGFPCTDDRPCTPHLTIAKRLQRPFSSQLKQKQWPPQCGEVRALCVQCHKSVVCCPCLGRVLAC